MKLVTLRADEYLKLLKAQDELDGLNALGVDNWSGRDDLSDVWDTELQDAEVLTKELFGYGVIEFE